MGVGQGKESADTCRHSISLEQIVAVVGTSGAISQTSQHPDVRNEERRGEQVAREAHKLVQAHLRASITDYTYFSMKMLQLDDNLPTCL